MCRLSIAYWALSRSRRRNWVSRFSQRPSYSLQLKWRSGSSGDIGLDSVTALLRNSKAGGINLQDPFTAGTRVNAEHEHWTRRLANDGVSVGSQAAQRLVDPAATYDHQV